MKNKLDFFKKFDKNYYTTSGYVDYLDTFEKRGEDLVKRLIKKIKPKKSWKFLDVGCGMGGTILALRKLGFEALGTEVSPFCLKNSPAKKWMRFGDICRLPFKDNSFEVVFNVDTFCYLTKSEIKRAVKELSRIMKYFLYFETICKDSPNSSQEKNPDELRKDKSLPTKEKLLRLFKKEGLRPLFSLFNSKEKVDFNLIFSKNPV